MNNTISNSVMLLLSSSFEAPWTVAYQSPLSMGFPRQKHRSGLPFPSLGHLPDPEIQPASPALVDSSLVATWESHQWCKQRLNSFPNLPSAISIVLIPMITDGHQSQLGFPFLHPARKMGSLCLCIFSLYKNHSFSFQASWGHMPSPRPIRDCFVLT